MFPKGFLFETADIVAADPSSVQEDVGGGAAADPTTVETPAPSGGEAAAPSFTDSLEFREAVAAAAESRLQTLLEGQTPDDSQPDPGQQFDPAALDPYSEDFGTNLLGALEQRMQALLDAKLSPIEQSFQQQAMERERAAVEAGTEGLKDVLADIQARPNSLGEFEDPSGQEEAIKLARELSPRYFQAYGQTDRAAELALEDAYKQVRTREMALMSKGEERYKNQLATLSGAPQQPGTGAVGIEQVPDEFRSIADMGRWMDQRRQATP